ncbi:MAG TPA: class I SAM-dependent methyltransferase [Acidimicrobiales bacterium]|nr:class I SAM-dependent methyltransferase [Acidimicrobiales bacterium]
MGGRDLSFLAGPDAVVDWRKVVLVDAADRAGILAALPDGAAGVAGRLGLDETAVRVVLDALGAWDVVVAGDDGRYALGPGAPEGSDGDVLNHHARAIRNWAGSLDDRLRGVPAVEGAPMPDPERWMSALAAGARAEAPMVVERCLGAAPGARTVLDLGGGHGEYALEFARRGLRATMQDRETMVELARRRKTLEAAGVELFAGDFFETLPDGVFDLVFCSGVTHTFGGDRVATLFRRAAGLVAPGGHLAVQTFLRARHPVASLFAVQMMANGRGGDTHSEEEYRRWLHDAGFAPPEVVDLDGGRRSLLVSPLGG